MKLCIDTNTKYGVFEGFGVSGAWWAQYVGGLNEITEQSDNMPLRDKISSLLFSKENGIGIDIYRYNIGAGSLDSGNGKIDNPLRRTYSLEEAPGKFNWSKDRNAVYMMKKAVEDGAEEVVLFVNSPPERLTKNNKAHLDKLFCSNINKSNYAEFAQFVCEIAVHFIKEGIPVKYISPVNEPVWIWNGGQEGCHYHPYELKPLFKAFANEMSKHRELDGVFLSGPESGDLRFFNKSYIRSMLADIAVKKRFNCIDTHSYSTQINIPLVKNILNNRLFFVKRYAKWAHKKYPDMPIKISEWTHMQGGRDSGMDSALCQTKIMLEDITLSDAVAWSHWIAVSEVDFCDGLIYIDIPQNTIELTKRYYCFGNFSLYIKRGMRRVACSINDSEIMSAAYTSSSQTVVVLANFSYSEKYCSISDLPGTQILTDKSQSLNKTSHASLNNAVLPPRSVSTFVF